jgi:hypothetical protein
MSKPAYPFDVALYVLSEHSGSVEDVSGCFSLAKRKYPQYFLELPEDEQEATEKVSAELKRMNAENLEAGKQIHIGLLLYASQLPEDFEDAKRKETGFWAVVASPVDDERYDELQDEVAHIEKCEGLFTRDESQTMEEFVDSLFTE